MGGGFKAGSQTVLVAVLICFKVVAETLWVAVSRLGMKPFGWQFEGLG